MFCLILLQDLTNPFQFLFDSLFIQKDMSLKSPFSRQDNSDNLQIHTCCHLFSFLSSLPQEETIIKGSIRNLYQFVWWEVPTEAISELITIFFNVQNKTQFISLRGNVA